MSLVDFDALVSSDSNFAKGWAEVNAHFDSEGADISKINSGKIAFMNSFDQLSSQAFGLSGSDAITAAKSYVIAGQTVAGAVNTIGGLINAGPSQSIPEVTQTFTGTLVGAATALGAMSAGVGAAIVGGVSVVLGIMQSIGLFGNPPDPVKWDFPIGDNVLAKVIGNNTPKQVSPGSPLWRFFPDPSNPRDSKWFEPIHGSGISVDKGGIFGDGFGGEEGTYNWQGLHFGTTQGQLKMFVTLLGAAGKRCIDGAFPNYADIVTNPIEADSFKKAYWTAWRSNAEYQFNGLKAQSDEDVLIHTLRLYNHAHEGPIVPVRQASKPYYASLINKALGQNPTDLVYQGGLGLNSGGMKLPPIRVISAAINSIFGRMAVSPTQINTVTVNPALVQDLIGKIKADQVIASVKSSRPIPPPHVTKSHAGKLTYATIGAASGFKLVGPLGGLGGGVLGYLLG